EIISREELREKLWPAHTFVDFDRSLNKAVTKLRSALADSAESPRYVETIPRHGYRFLASVQTYPNHTATRNAESRAQDLAAAASVNNVPKPDAISAIGGRSASGIAKNAAVTPTFRYDNARWRWRTQIFYFGAFAAVALLALV